MTKTVVDVFVTQIGQETIVKYMTPEGVIRIRATTVAIVQTVRAAPHVNAEPDLKANSAKHP